MSECLNCGGHGYVRFNVAVCCGQPTLYGECCGDPVPSEEIEQCACNEPTPTQPEKDKGE